MHQIQREGRVCSNLCPVWMMVDQELKEIDHLIVDAAFFSLPTLLSPPRIILGDLGYMYNSIQTRI